MISIERIIESLHNILGDVITIFENAHQINSDFFKSNDGMLISQIKPEFETNVIKEYGTIDDNLFFHFDEKISESTYDKILKDIYLWYSNLSEIIIKLCIEKDSYDILISWDSEFEDYILTLYNNDRTQTKRIIGGFNN